MSTPLISVVIPNYNYAGFLPAAIGSVAAQTYPATELLVVDDASSDNSIAVLESLKHEFESAFSGGFRIVRNEKNEGAHAALNRGIRMSTGELISILNADDLYEEKRLEKMQNAMELQKSPFAFSAVRCMDQNKAPLDTSFAQQIELLPGKAVGKMFLLQAAVAENIAVSTGNMVFSRTLFEETGGFAPYRYVHDYDFLLKVALIAEPVYVPDTAYWYRIHGSNSFTRLAKIGIPENRLVWLDLYGAIKKGNIKNPVVLAHPDYRALFYEAVRDYGFQKKTLWHMAATPFGAAVAAFMKARLKRALKTDH